MGHRTIKPTPKEGKEEKPQTSKTRRSSYARQKAGKIFTKGDVSFASWDIQRIKWDNLRNQHSTSKKSTPTQRKKNKDNTIKKGKPS
jgi:hypothetical protein